MSISRCHQAPCIDPFLQPAFLRRGYRRSAKANHCGNDNWSGHTSHSVGKVQSTAYSPRCVKDQIMSGVSVSVAFIPLRTDNVIPARVIVRLLLSPCNKEVRSGKMCAWWLLYNYVCRISRQADCSYSYGGSLTSATMTMPG